MRVAIIPARGGSRRIPRKNIRPFHGKPIIAYSIEAARLCGVLDAVFVSTDDAEIAEIANQHKAAVLWRPEPMAEDDVGTQDVMRDALERMPTVSVACCIYPCAPMLKAITVRDAYDNLGPGVDYVVPISTWLRDPGQFYMGNADAFRKRKPLAGPWTRILRIDPATDCDINTEDDWQRAERMYAELHHLNEEKAA